MLRSRETGFSVIGPGGPTRAEKPPSEKGDLSGGGLKYAEPQAMSRCPKGNVGTILQRESNGDRQAIQP